MCSKMYWNDLVFSKTLRLVVDINIVCTYDGGGMIGDILFKNGHKTESQ